MSVSEWPEASVRATGRRSWTAPLENLRDRDANPARHWEPARAGVADITWGNFTHEPERFVSTGFSEFPNAGTAAEAQSVALWRTYEAQLANLSPGGLEPGRRAVGVASSRKGRFRGSGLFTVGRKVIESQFVV